MSHASQEEGILGWISVAAVLEGLEDTASNLFSQFSVVSAHLDDHWAEFVSLVRLHEILEHLLLAEHVLGLFREGVLIKVLRQVHHEVE